MELAKLIEKSWQAESYHQNSFAEICFDQLNRFQLDLTLNQFEKMIADWVLESSLPKQLNVYNNFGQPPITLFNNDKFVLDIYFWMHVDTSIHSHAFSGAFKLLYGRSIHENFSVTPKIIYAQDVMSSDISQPEARLLCAGETQKIHSGNKFNHRLIHLDAPTITLCARTVDDVKNKQWHHFPNGLSIEKRTISESVIKGLYYYQYLFIRNQELAIHFLYDLIKSWDISVSLNLYEQLAVDNMGIENDAIDCFSDILIDLYGDSEWFKIYESFNKQMQENTITIDGNSVESRFLEHAINSSYPFEQTKSLLEEVQGHALSQQQIDLLKAHN